MNQTRVLVLLAGLPGLSFAQPCKDIKDDAERLACYDAQDSASPAAEQEAPVLPAAPAARAAVAADLPDEFGARKPDDAPQQFIEARIEKIEKRGSINYLFLDNGHVWREQRDNSLLFKEGRSVTITEGILNSFDLKMEGARKVVKVKRVR